MIIEGPIDNNNTNNNNIYNLILILEPSKHYD